MSYKIKSLELVNYIGIYSGIGENRIKIDFTSNENEIILLLGSNGSGKTTVLSNSHPYYSTYDIRDKIILEGLEGKKEIIYHSQDDEIIITHYSIPNKNEYSHKVKSFFSLNGKELNENGTVRSFNKLVEEHLGLTEDYFKVGKIGSNVTNFINLKPTERKQFIANFLPDTSEYLEKNKLAKKRYTEVNSQFKFVSDELYKLGDVKEIVSSKRILEKEYNKTKEELESLNVERIEYETEIKNAKKSGFVNEFKEIEESPNKDTIEQLRKEIIKYSLNLGFYKDVSIIDFDIAKENKRLEYFKDSNNKNEKSKFLLELELVSIDNKISHKNEILSKPKELLLKKKNLLEKKDIILKDIESSKEELDCYEYSNIYQQMNYIHNHIIHNAKSTKDIIKDILDINNLLSFLNSYMVGKSIDDDYLKFDISIYQLKDEIRLLTIDKNKYFTQRDLYKIELQEYEYKLHTLEELSNKLEELHTNSCSNKDCPYEKIFLEGNDIYKKIDPLHETIKNNKELIESTEEKIKSREVLLEILEDLSKLDYSILNIVYNEKYKDFFDIINNKDYYALAYYLKKLYKPIDLNPNILNDIYEAIKFSETLNNKLIELENNIAEIDADENFIKNTEEELVSLKDKQREIEDNTDLVNNSILENNNKINECIANINKLENHKVDLNKLEELTKNRDELVKQDEEHNIKLKELILIRNKWEEVKYSIVDKEEELKQIENNLNTYKLKIQRTKEYLATKKELEGKLLKINYIKESTDPKTGIPLEIIKDNIGSIKDITNKLLDIAYNGSFQIEDFVVTETEFLIPVRKPDGSKVRDVLECSQGQVALTKICISLSIIHSLLGDYKILYLDEFDCELDTRNLHNFVNIISSLIKELNIEQLFLISHNLCVSGLIYGIQAGIILFSGNEYEINNDVYNNKTIIKDFTI